jgi:hypothetical protein
MHPQQQIAAARAQRIGPCSERGAALPRARRQVAIVAIEATVQQASATRCSRATGCERSSSLRG